MNKITETQPPMQRPPNPKHVPFWPVLVGIIFMVAVVISGIIASNHARKEHLTISTSTLPPKNAKATTTTTAAPATTAAGQTQAGQAAPTIQGATGPSACTAANLQKAIQASGQADPSLVGAVTVPQFKCVQGYAFASVKPGNPNVDTVTADFKLSGGNWQLISLGDVNPLNDGVPRDIAAQLVLS